MRQAGLEVGAAVEVIEEALSSAARLAGIAGEHRRAQCRGGRRQPQVLPLLQRQGVRDARLGDARVRLQERQLHQAPGQELGDAERLDLRQDRLGAVGRAAAGGAAPVRRRRLQLHDAEVEAGDERAAHVVGRLPDPHRLAQGVAGGGWAAQPPQGVAVHEVGHRHRAIESERPSRLQRTLGRPQGAGEVAELGVGQAGVRQGDGGGAAVADASCHLGCPGEGLRRLGEGSHPFAVRADAVEQGGHQGEVVELAGERQRLLVVLGGGADVAADALERSEPLEGAQPTVVAARLGGFEEARLRLGVTAAEVGEIAQRQAGAFG